MSLRPPIFVVSTDATFSPRCLATRIQNASFSTVSGNVAISGLRIWSMASVDWSSQERLACESGPTFLACRQGDSYPPTNAERGVLEISDESSDFVRTERLRGGRGWCWRRRIVSWLDHNRASAIPPKGADQPVGVALWMWTSRAIEVRDSPSGSKPSRNGRTIPCVYRRELTGNESDKSGCPTGTSSVPLPCMSIEAGLARGR